MNRFRMMARARRAIEARRRKFKAMHEDCFTVAGAAKKYRIAERTVRRWIVEGMPCIKDDKSGLILIRRRDIEKHILYG